MNTYLYIILRLLNNEFVYIYFDQSSTIVIMRPPDPKISRDKDIIAQNGRYSGGSHSILFKYLINQALSIDIPYVFKTGSLNLSTGISLWTIASLLRRPRGTRKRSRCCICLDTERNLVFWLLSMYQRSRYPNLMR